MHKAVAPYDPRTRCTLRPSPARAQSKEYSTPQSACTEAEHMLNMRMGKYLMGSAAQREPPSQSGHRQMSRERSLKGSGVSVISDAERKRCKWSMNISEDEEDEEAGESRHGHVDTSDSEDESDDDRRTRATEQDARRRPESSTSAREQRWRSVPVVLPVPTGMKLTSVTWHTSQQQPQPPVTPKRKRVGTPPEEEKRAEVAWRHIMTPLGPQSSKSVDEEMLILEKKRYKCELCVDFYTGSKKDLQRHLESRQHKEPSHVCPVFPCKKAFTREDGLKRHIKTVHVLVQPSDSPNLKTGPEKIPAHIAPYPNGPTKANVASPVQRKEDGCHR